MLSLKHATKSRALTSPLHLLNKSIFNSPSSSINPSASCYCYYYSTSQVVAAVHGFNNVKAEDVLLSFKEWFNFRPQNTVVLDWLFEILSTHDAEVLASRYAPDRVLSQLGIRLTESFVLEVLAYGKTKDVLSCLKFFDWAGRQHGFRHTHATFYAIFKILSKAKLRPLMLDFLESFKKGGYYHQSGFKETLVMGYAVAGKPQIALKLYGQMRFQGLDLNGYAYHVLLNALVEMRCFDAVDAISKQISLRGFENEVTRSILLKSLCKQKQLDKAVAHMRELVSEGRLVTGYMISSVMSALCEGNSFEQAGKLLEEFRDCGAVQLEQAYGIWLQNLVESGRIDAALEFLESKKSIEGYVPEVYRYNILVNRLLRENRLMEVFDLFKEMKENQISPDCITMNTALCFFCKAGMVDVAIQLYDSRLEFGLSPNGMFFNYLINTLCGDGNTDAAYRVLENSIDQGFFPGRKTFSILADALCREGKLEKMKNLIVFALERDIMPSDTMYYKFISALCRANRVEDGYMIFEKLCGMNKVLLKYSYFKLIQGFSKSNRGEKAARLLMQMQENGHKPTPAELRATICCLSNMEIPDNQFLQLLQMCLSGQQANSGIYNIFINGAGHAKRPELARAVYEMMQRSGFKPTLISCILMLRSYLKSGKISDAVNFFGDLCQRGRVQKKLYNFMILGMCNAMKADTALEFMMEMKKNGMVPSMECYERIIKLLCSNKKYDMVIHLINDLEEVGHHVTSFVGNTLLFHSLKTQDLYEAWIRLRGLQNDTSRMTLLGQLIGVFSGCIKLSQDVKDLPQIIEQCFPLDTFSYNMILRILGKSQINDACELFSRMCQKGYKPNQHTYDILKRALDKNFSMDEAKKRVGGDVTTRAFLTFHLKQFI